jgi:hypothetical protein
VLTFLATKYSKTTNILPSSLILLPNTCSLLWSCLLHVTYDCHSMSTVMTKKILHISCLTQYFWEYQFTLYMTINILSFLHCYLPFITVHILCFIKPAPICILYAVFKPLFLLCAHDKLHFHTTVCSILHMHFTLMLHKICNILEQASMFLIALFLS